MLRLLFPLPDVLTPAEHAITAPEHRESFRDTLNATKPKPGLWFVGDEGPHRMSNELPGQPHPIDGDRPQVVYAAGATHVVIGIGPMSPRLSTAAAAKPEVIR